MNEAVTTNIKGMTDIRYGDGIPLIPSSVSLLVPPRFS